MTEAELFGGRIDAGDMNELITTGAGVYGVRFHQDSYPDDPREGFGVDALDVAAKSPDSWTSGRNGDDYIGHALTALTGNLARGYCGEMYSRRVSPAAFVRYLALAGYRVALVDGYGEMVEPSAKPLPYGWNVGYCSDSHAAEVLIDRYSKTAEEAERVFAGYQEAARAYRDGDIWEVDVIDPDGDTIETAQGYYGDGSHDEMRIYAAAVVHGDAERRGKQEADAAAAKATRKAAEAGRKADEAAAIAAAYDADLETRIAELSEALAAAKETRRHNIARARVTIAAAANATTREESAA
jgi:hypothetical protein